MIRGLYTSALGMATQQRRLDVVSNNVANANTTGFKADTVVMQSFPEHLINSIEALPNSEVHRIAPIGRLNLGVSVSSVHTNFANGGMEQTGGPLDLAISGGGFFAVGTTDAAGDFQERFTRTGSFSLSADRTLITQNGDQVLGVSGQPITIPDGEIHINESGEIYVGQLHVDTIRIVDFEEPQFLRSPSYNLFVPIEGAAEIPFTGRVSQGFLEGSNVNIVREMVDMIALSRAHEVNQRMITIHDTTLGQAVSEIARRQ